MSFRYSLPASTPVGQQRDRELEDHLDGIDGRLSLLGDGTWESPMVLGSAWLWVDATGDLRIAAAEPTSDLDGAVVGTQA